MKYLNNINKIFVEESALGYPLTQNTLSYFKNIKPLIIKDVRKFVRETEINIDESKRTVFIMKGRGAFLKKCPGTPQYLCCNYHILNTGINCPFDCSYCYLQHYLNKPGMTLYANTGDMLDEIKSKISKTPEKYKRIGTGEFSDSLALDPATKLSSELINFFIKYPGIFLEFKTKSACIENLLKIKSAPNIVIAWSLNPQRFIQTDEKGTASLTERIGAAEKITKHGFSAAFHFDPLIETPDFNFEYGNIIKLISSKIPASKIKWISVGSLRYNPDLTRIIKKRHKNSKIYTGHLIKGTDNKYRYFRFVRENMYKTLIKAVNKLLPGVKVYFCMESPGVWKNCMGCLPYKNKNLSFIFGSK